MRGEDFTPASDPKFESPGAVPFFRRRPTQGILGTMFLDAGVRELANALGEGYTVLINEWFAEAVKKARGPVAGLVDEPDLTDEAQALQARSNINDEILAAFNSSWARLGL